MAGNSSVLEGMYHARLGFSSGLYVVLSSVGRAVCGTRNINLTTPRVNVLHHFYVVSINSNLVRLVGPIVLRRDNDRVKRRNYLSIPSGCTSIRHPVCIGIETRSEFNGGFIIRNERLGTETLYRRVSRLSKVLCVSGMGGW